MLVNSKVFFADDLCVEVDWGHFFLIDWLVGLLFPPEESGGVSAEGVLSVNLFVVGFGFEDD